MADVIAANYVIICVVIDDQIVLTVAGDSHDQTGAMNSTVCFQKFCSSTAEYLY